MANYTKGEISEGWIHVSDYRTPIALVHPKYVDKFIVAPEMYEALKALLTLHDEDLKMLARGIGTSTPQGQKILRGQQALVKAEGKARLSVKIADTEEAEITRRGK